MARRRSFYYQLRRGTLDLDDDDLDEDSVGAFDRLVGLFWPEGGRFRWCFWNTGSGGNTNADAGRQEAVNLRGVGRCIGEVATFLGCLVALLVFSLLFLALVVCIPLTWIVVDGNAEGVTAGTCVRLLNAFGLQALLKR